MSVTATIAQNLSVVETLDNNTDPIAAANRKVTWGALSAVSESLTASTTVPATKVAGGQVALVAGAKTLDLTALTGLGANGATEDFTGLKVQALFMKNPATNSGSISIAPGASNGYEFNGSDGKLTLSPGQSVLLYLADSAPDVADSSADQLDFAGTGTEEFDIVMVAG
jgi:hypothetical protein